jgi:hypothetical protein
VRTRVGAWLFALSLFGYPIIGSFVAVLQIDSQQVTVPFRLAIGAVCVLILTTRGRIALDVPRILLLVCGMAYAGRLICDAIGEVSGALYALQFFIIGSVLPALAQWKIGSFDAKLYARTTFIVTSAGCSSMLVGRYAGLFGGFDLFETTGRLATQTVNAVTVGHLAVSGMLSGIVLWPNSYGVHRWILAPVMALLLATLLLSGSKGPALVLGLLLLARAIWGGVTGRSVFALTCLISLAALCFDQIPLIDRVRNVSGDLSTSWRVDLIHDSLLQIIDRPWIGSAFVEMSSGLYAHTILLDAPMAIGLPLASVLLFIVLFAVRWALRMLSGPDSVFGLLYLQAVLGAVFSGALYGAALFWTTITIVLALGARANAALLRKQCGRDHRLWMKPFDSAKPIR